jgi:hypothetical protein
MTRTLIIILASLILLGCGATGDGTQDRLNTTVKDRNYANLFFKYSTNPTVAGYPPKVIINNSNQFLLGDNESIVVKANQGPLNIDVWSTKGRIFNKNLRKNLVEKNNNYYFVIVAEKFDYPFSDYLKGVLPTPDYKLYETHELAFHGYKSDQLGNITRPTAAPTLFSLNEKIFTNETLKEISLAEQNLKKDLEPQIQKTIIAAEDACIKKGLDRNSKAHQACTSDTWKAEYGKKYTSLILEISKENKNLEKLISDSKDNDLVEINSSRMSVMAETTSSLEFSENTQDLIKFAVIVVASYYLGKAIGDVLKTNVSAKSPAPAPAAKQSSFRYICTVNYGGGCGPRSGYAFIH